MELWCLYKLVIILGEIYNLIYITFYLINIYGKQVGMQLRFSPFIKLLLAA